MAGEERRDRVLNNILSRVEELSEVLSPNGDTARTTAVNEEVSRAFNRGRQPNTYVEQLTVPESNSGNPANAHENSSGNTVPSVTRSLPLGPLRPVSSRPSADQRRYFPALNYNKRFLNSSTSRRQPRKKKPPSGPFIRDVILLAGPNVKIVPRQGARVQLMESGHIICGFELMKEWKNYDVEMHIRSAFGDKLADNVDIEILMSVHNTLHPPSLPPNQTLSGFMVHKVFKDKPIYIRPSVQILACFEKKGKKIVDHEELCGMKSDSSDDELMRSTDIQLRHPGTQRAGIHHLALKPFDYQPLTQPSEVQHTRVQLHGTQTRNSQALDSQAEIQPDIQVIEPCTLIPDSQLAAIQPSGIEPDNQPVALQHSDMICLGDEIPEIQPPGIQNGIENPEDPSISNPTNQSNSCNVPDTSAVNVEAAATEEILPVQEDVVIKNIVIHRAKLKEDLISEFRDTNILKVMVVVDIVNERGEFEKGEGRGLLRDIITEFWNLLFISAAVGASQKVPAIRHDFQSEEWEAIARILVYGYIREGYFPIQLSPAFLSLCLFGECSITQLFLVESFKAYISMEEQEIVNNVVSGKLNPTDDEVLEFLSSYNCFKAANKENIESIIWQLAHQEIIQKPRYVANCWGPIVSKLKAYLPVQSPNNLVSLFDEKRPTGKKVIKLLDAHPCNDAERACLSHLKRYIRSIEGNIGCFLHFTTGSNILVCQKLSIIFNKLDGKIRRPIAHTCAPSLEIPSTYQSYNELAEEFSNVLRQKGSWEFDIV